MTEECTGDINGWDMTVSFAKELEAAMSELQDTLAEIIHGDDDGVESPSGLVYCGCQTCDVRELLFVFAPKIAEGLEQGRIYRSAESADPLLESKE